MWIIILKHWCMSHYNMDSNFICLELQLARKRGGETRHFCLARLVIPAPEILWMKQERGQHGDEAKYVWLFYKEQAFSLPSGGGAKPAFWMRRCSLAFPFSVQAQLHTAILFFWVTGYLEQNRPKNNSESQSDQANLGLRLSFFLFLKE